jgi:hypothetical protein
VKNITDQQWQFIKQGQIDQAVEDLNRQRRHAIWSQLRYAKSDRESQLLIELSLTDDPLRQKIIEYHLSVEQIRQLETEIEEKENERMWKNY